jgi:hypothetical protein
MGLVERRLMAALEHAATQPSQQGPQGCGGVQKRVHVIGGKELQRLSRDGTKHGRLLPHERGNP